MSHGASTTQAEETTIKMVPKFTHGVLHFISGDFGPFEPQLPVDVPLWLAIQLRRQQVGEVMLAAGWCFDD